MALIDPRTKHPSDFPSEPRQDNPGLETKMATAPDLGQDSYVGSGKLEGRRALITGGDVRHQCVFDGARIGGYGLVAEFFGHKYRSVVIDGLRHSHHDAQLHQSLDDFATLKGQLLRQFGNTDRFADSDFANDRSCRLLEGITGITGTRLFRTTSLGAARIVTTARGTGRAALTRIAITAQVQTVVGSTSTGRTRRFGTCSRRTLFAAWRICSSGGGRMCRCFGGAALGFEARSFCSGSRFGGFALSTFALFLGQTILF